MKQDIKYWLFCLLIPIVVYLSFRNNGMYNKNQKEEIGIVEKKDSIVKYALEEIRLFVTSDRHNQHFYIKRF